MKAQSTTDLLRLASAAVQAAYAAVAVRRDDGGYDLVDTASACHLEALPGDLDGLGPAVVTLESSPLFPDARFCAAIPLDPVRGLRAGVLFIVDTVARPWTAGQQLLAEAVARQLVISLDSNRYPLFLGSPHPMWVTEVCTTRLLAVNEAAISLYGYTREEFLSMSLADLRPAADVAEFRTRYAAAGYAAMPLNTVGQGKQTRHQRKDGSLIDVEVRYTRIEFEGQQALLVSPLDITARCQAEDALRDSELRFRRLTEATFDGICIHEDGLIRECNAGMGNIFGYTQAEFVGLPVLKLIAPESESLVRDRIRRGVEDLARYVGQRKDGTPVHLECITRNHTWHGRLYRLVAMRDISETYWAEAALRQSEQRFRAIFVNSDTGIALLNVEGRVLQCNPALCRILATPESSIQGHTTRAFALPEHLSNAVTLFQELRDGTRDHFRVERPFRRGDGGSGWAHITVSAIRPEAGGSAFAVCMVEDISQRKADEAQRRGLEEQLLQSQKVEALGRLAGGVAHDFNNLLTTVQGYGYLLRSELSGSPHLLHFAEEIVKTSEEAAGLTRQLLAFSRKQPLVAVPVDMNGVVLEMEEILHRLLPNHITMGLDLDPEAGQILADPVQIKQVVLNLVVNARDAMPTGGQLHLRTERVPGDLVCLQVQDTGIGMGDDVKAHLFEPFFTTKPHGEGTGLGLATCYGIVKQSHGFFTVDSAAGQGSSFKVTLPRLGDSQPATTDAEEPAPPHGGDETILVVEDTRPLRELVCQVLRNLGYQVLEASDGEEAVETWTSHPEVQVDLVLTDVLMPQMDGHQLARWVQARSSSTRVLFMSGHNEVPGLQHGNLAPGVALLAKPFSPARLAEAVRQVLDADATAASG